ncbi:MAG TPA: hypothetical protein VFG04_02570 [Planctomycetaceae bacterium]|jgi:hypothetical protein|nr:hypothetical protein [Planctomycetaceae bacterium]
MKQFRWLVALATTVTAAQFASGAEPTPALSRYTRPYPIVGVPTGASEAHKALAQQVAVLIGHPPIVEQRTNPVCCIWIEINGFTPNPGKAGYVIVNDAGGSIIAASDLEQLRAAVQRFKKSIRSQDGKPEIPIGLLTNYPVVPAD